MINPRNILWEKKQNIRSKDELNKFHSEVSITSYFSHWSVPHLWLIISLTTIFLFGYILTIISKVSLGSLYSPFLLVFAIDLFITVETIFWLDKVCIKVIEKIRPAFSVSEKEYYTFMGEMMERIYEPLPHTPSPDGHKIHIPITISFVFGILFLIFIPIILNSSLIAELIGTRWGILPFIVKGYFLAILAIATITGVFVSWIVITGSVYMGYRIQKFKINLDITKSHNNLGLDPYASLTIRALLIYLLVYFVTTVAVFRSSNPLHFFIIFIMSFLPVVGLIGSQYGLHSAVQRSKEARLEELGDEFSSDINRWFQFEEKKKTDISKSSQSITKVISAKREIENLPEWAINFESVAQLASATFAANAWVVLQAIGFV